MRQGLRHPDPICLSRAVFAALLGTVLLSSAQPAQAARWAMIMGIAHYTDPAGDLPGIDIDMQAAGRIASAMGVPPSNITQLKDAQLTYDGLSKAFKNLTQRIQPGDQVLLYYSGHGGQTANISGSEKKCSEGIVAQDVKLYFDRELEADLAGLGAKASQVVMMNDSCFSGGTSVKAIGPRAKAFPGKLRKATGAVAPAAADCGVAVNKGMLSKSFDVVPRAGANLLYIAAAADNEVSYASDTGSIATQAWAACVVDPAADTDNSGSITGEELRVCAQARMDASPLKVVQHTTLTGTRDLIVSSVGTAAGASSARTVVPSRALQDIRAGADKSFSVTLNVTSPQPLHIGQDNLQFDVVTNREGYLYIFQVGTEGAGTTLLFPNKVDAANRLPAGKHQFPRASWALKSGGPAGTNHLMALLSDEKKDYAEFAKPAGNFGTVPANAANTKGFVVVSTGVGRGQKGRYGASEVVQVTEAP